MFRGLFRVVLSLYMVAVGQVGVVSCLFVITRFVVLSGG